MDAREKLLHSDASTTQRELESGKKYEIVVTTHDGLWRYQLKDIIEVGGFDPTDGQPIVRLSESSGFDWECFLLGLFDCLIFLHPKSTFGFMVNLFLRRCCIIFAKHLRICQSEFASAIDHNRKVVPAYGSFDGKLGAKAHEAPKALKLLHQELFKIATTDTGTQYDVTKLSHACTSPTPSQPDIEERR